MRGLWRSFPSGWPLWEQLELVEVSLDEVPLSVGVDSDGTLDLPVALYGDVPASTMCCNQVKDAAGVVAKACHDITRGGMSCQQIPDCRLVGGLAC